MDLRGLMSDPQFRLGMGLLAAGGPMPANIGLGQRLGMAMGQFDEWDAQQRRLKMLEAEERRREEDSKTNRQLHGLQMEQLRKAMEQAERERKIKADMAARFASAGQPSAPVPAMPAGPLNPDMSPVDLSMLARNHQQARAAQPAPNQFPYSVQEVAALAAQGYDLTKLRDWWTDVKEMKPGSTYRDQFGNMTEMPQTDFARNMTGTSAGVRPIPGAAAITNQSLADAENIRSEAGARFNYQPQLDLRRGSETYGLVVPMSPREIEADRLGLPYTGGPVRPPQAQQAPLQAPQAALAPRPMQPPQPAAPAAPAAAQPGQTAPTDRPRILNDEIAIEQAKLRELTSMSEPNYRLKYGTNAEPREVVIQRTQNNLQSLQRELSGGRPAPAPAPGQQVAPNGIASPEAAKTIEAQRGMEARIEASRNAMINVGAAIGTAFEKLGFMSTGLIGQIMQNVGGTSAKSLREAAETLKANLSADNLQQIRDFSATGAGVGNVALGELELLGKKVASLDITQDEATLRKNLITVQRHYENYMRAMNDAYARKYGRQFIEPGGSWGAGPADIPIDQLIKQILSTP